MPGWLWRWMCLWRMWGIWRWLWRMWGWGLWWRWRLRWRIWRWRLWRWRLWRRRVRWLRWWLRRLWWLWWRMRWRWWLLRRQGKSCLESLNMHFQHWFFAPSFVSTVACHQYLWWSQGSSGDWDSWNKGGGPGFGVNLGGSDTCNHEMVWNGMK